MWMQSDTVLEVEGLSKLYSRIQGATRKRLANTFTRTLWGRSPRKDYVLTKGEFWSLKDVSFSLKRGEALGVIGLNGAGKTTLLRLLAGQILPDQGEIRILGRAAAMIDLTAGFQMSASGQRNIYLRGAMLGRSREEIAATYDEIVDFAELGDAINAPVSTYSSGMLMRLAFSIMVATRPDVLFIDEILSVGDFRFRQKCLTKIRELRKQSAFVLVSHSMNDIKHFCDHVILLHKGRVVSEGDPEDVVGTYEAMKLPEPLDSEKKRTEILKPQFHNNDVIEEVEHFWCDEDGTPIVQIRSGSDLYLKATFRINHKPRRLILGVPVWTEDGTYVTGFSTETQKEQLMVELGKRNEFLLKVPRLAFNPGAYISNLAITDGPEFLHRAENPLLNVTQAANPYWGVVSFPHTWEQII
jgi:ABC-type polysaccharide/polyol phosphate transport system ATPase subunit